MKITIRNILFTFIILLFSLQNLLADGNLIAYYRVGILKGSLEEVRKKVEVRLQLSDYEFEVLGGYNPARSDSLYVIAFTRKDLTDICLEVKDRGVLASILKIGLMVLPDSTVEVSLLNPEYLFYAYLRDDVAKYAEDLSSISNDVKLALLGLENTFFWPFGASSLNDEQIKNFKYTVRMPGFDDIVVLQEFGSFEKGVHVISSNLEARKGRSFKVYQRVFGDVKIAIFGVGLWDGGRGEADFLYQLGKDHLAALPYEVVLIGKQATILHGRYRFPLFWSDLSMKEYKKIYKTPRSVEQMLKKLTR